MIMLSDAITYIRLFGTETALDYIEKRQNPKFCTKCGPTIEQVKDTFETLKALANPIDTSPLLEKLIDILNSQFESDSNSRVLIFLQQREFCLKLSNLLTNKTNHPTSYLTGIQAQEGGQNPKEQRAVIDGFASGKISVLCATTVAEEGLDISACNLVIEYNHVTNEIARVQRRGRSRAKKARSILLTCDLPVKEKEEQNRIREKLMYAALEDIGRMPPRELLQKITELIKEINKKRAEKRAIEEKEKDRQRALTKNCDYFIVCRECRSLLGMSHTVVVVSGSQYVLADKDFWSKVTVKKWNDSKLSQRAEILGEHFCSNKRETGMCYTKLGRIVRHRSVFLPVISLSGIVFVKSAYKGQKTLPVFDQTDECIKKKLWKQVNDALFHIEPITSILLTDMKNAAGTPEYLNMEEDSMTLE